MPSGVVGGASNKLERQRARRRFFDLFAQSQDWRGAAEAAGVSERTGRRWHTEALTLSRRALPRALANPTRFVGRSRDIETIANHFRAGARLVTVVGAPGMGKTRLAARILGERLWGGAVGYFCDLQAARTVDDLCAVLSQALEAPLVSANGRDAVDHLGRVLSVREACCVVLDNFEQLVEAGALAVSRWMQTAPHVQFLVTSRRRLRLEWEQVHALEPLSLPDLEPTEASTLNGDAVELFVDRGTRADSMFRIDAFPTEDVVALVHRLEGIPLAIELAAGQMARLTPRGLLDLLEQDALRLRSPYRDAERRHATLQSAIEGSWHLLSSKEQSALARLSVFRGGFDPEAAAVVGTLGNDRATASFDTLADRLREMSLLRSIEGEPRGARRWDLFMSIRDFASERLREMGDEGAARSAHAQYFLDWGERRALEIPTAKGLEARAALTGELDNLRAAFEWWAAQADHSGLDVRPALRMGLVIGAATRHPLPRLAIDVLTRALVLAREASDVPDIGTLLAKLRLARAAVCRDTGDHSLAEADLAEARGVGDHDSVVAGEIEYESGMLCLFKGLPHPARAHLERALDLSTVAQDPHLEGRAHSALGWVLAEAFQDPRAFGHHEQAASKLQMAGDAYEEAIARRTWNCHRMFFQRGEAIDALSRLAETFALAHGHQDRVFALHNLGMCHLDRGQFELAREFFDRAYDEALRHGFLRCDGILEFCRGLASDTMGSLEEAAEAYSRSTEKLASVGDVRFEALALTFMGGLEARRGDPERAESLLGRAALLTERSGDAGHRNLVELQRGQVELAYSRRAQRLGRREESETLHTRATDRATAARGPGQSQYNRLVRLPLVRCSFEARLILRSLELELKNVNDQRPALCVWDEGGAFQIAGRPRVVLPRGPVIRGTLMLLVRHRVNSPGVPLHTDELLAQVWPGERILPDSASVRVRNTIARLRRAGLDGVLLTDESGYLLDPDVPLRVVELTSAAAV